MHWLYDSPTATLWIPPTYYLPADYLTCLPAILWIRPCLHVPATCRCIYQHTRLFHILLPSFIPHGATFLTLICYGEHAVLFLYATPLHATAPHTWHYVATPTVAVEHRGACRCCLCGITNRADLVATSYLFTLRRRLHVVRTFLVVPSCRYTTPMTSTPSSCPEAYSCLGQPSGHNDQTILISEIIEDCILKRDYC